MTKQAIKRRVLKSLDELLAAYPDSPNQKEAEMKRKLAEEIREEGR